jgi:hypothetical protein
MLHSNDRKCKADDLNTFTVEKVAASVVHSLASRVHRPDHCVDSDCKVYSSFTS